MAGWTGESGSPSTLSSFLKVGGTRLPARERIGGVTPLEALPTRARAARGTVGKNTVLVGEAHFKNGDQSHAVILTPDERKYDGAGDGGEESDQDDDDPWMVAGLDEAAGDRG